MIRLLFVLLFTSLTAFSAFVALRIPFLSVGMPHSLPGAEALYQWHGLIFGSHVISAQLPLVWMTGALLGARRGGLSMALYLALGLGGLPIFANGGGLAYVTQPTFGYLAAFVPAVIVVGALARDQRFGRTWLGMLLGLAVIQSFGLAYELLVRHLLLSPLSWWAIAWEEVFQFVPGQLALLTALAFVIATVRKLDALYLAWSDDRAIAHHEPLLPEA